MDQKKSASAKLEKVFEKFKALFADKKYYEALQLCKTLVMRHNAAKQFDQSEQLAFDVTKNLLAHKQGAAGAELANLMIETYKKAAMQPNDERIERVVAVFQAFPDEAEDAATAFMKDAIQWTTTKPTESTPSTSTSTGNLYGAPALHAALARRLSATGSDHSASQRHWLRAGQPQEHAKQVLSWAKTGLRGEADLFAARATIQYLALSNLKDANLFWEAIRELYTTESWSLDSPLAHFVNFLLKTCERDAAPLFRLLKQQYAVSLARDPQLQTYLDKVGEVFFGIPVSQGMFGDLLNLTKGLL